MEETISDEVKVAEHSRFKCLHCSKMIKKGLPVIRMGRTTKYGYQHSSYCYECYDKYQRVWDKSSVEKMINMNANVEKRFEEIKEECTKAIILEKLEGKKGKKIRGWEVEELNGGNNA